MNSSPVTALYAALAANDAGAIAATLTAGAVLHVPGTHPFAGRHHGTAAILGFLAASRSATDSGERVEMLDVLAGRRHVAVYATVRAERAGATLANPTLHLIRTEGDRVAEIWFHNREQAPVDAFWSGGDR